MKGKKRRRPLKNQDFNEAADSSYQADENSQNNIEEINSSHPEKKVVKRHPSESLMKNAEEQTAGGESVEGHTLPQPYEFLKFANPSLHMIFFPHFSVWTVNFWLSILLTVLFIVLIIFSYTKEQNDFTWNCSLFKMQNKFFPRLRYGFQFWRVIISGFFHSNIAHFCLNVFGLQVYGYFVQKYYGRIKFIVSLLVALIATHFFAAAVNHESISTMASCHLFCVIGMKMWFLFEYRQYKPLQYRKFLIYLLLFLIVVINLIPIFVVNNVDFSSHLGGLITGGLIGSFFHFRKQEQSLQTDQQRSQYPRIWKTIKWGSLVMIAVFFVACVSAVFATDTETLYAMNYKIEEKCQ